MGRVLITKNIMTFSAEIFTQSSIARSDVLASCDREKALELLAQAQEYAFGTLLGKDLATTEEVSLFYEVEPATLRKIIERNRAELEAYGLKTVSRKELILERDDLSLSRYTRRATLWTPISTLALGLMLEVEVSRIAQNVRRVTLTAAIGKDPTLPPAPALPPTSTPTPIYRSFGGEVIVSHPNLINGKVVCLEEDWPRILWRPLRGVDVYVDSETGVSGLMIEALTWLSGVGESEIKVLAKNLKGQRQGVATSFKGVRRDNVYLLHENPAVINGKGIDESFIIYHHEFCTALLQESALKGHTLARKLRDFCTPVGGLHPWLQYITYWRDFTDSYGNNDLGISYRELEGELMWESLKPLFPNEEEREAEYGMYFGVRPEKSMQLSLPPITSLPWD